MTDALRVINNAYYDSATLMSVAQRVKGEDGIGEAVAVMGTDHNRELLSDVGFAGKSLAEATPRTLILAVRADSQARADEAINEIERGLKDRSGGSTEGADSHPASIAQALEQFPQTNVVLISVPGEYAAREARKAIDADRHVMIFSDNVSLEDEISLKQQAAQKGVLMMGPDCGTAIINGVPLAFANVVRPGPIGIIAAAGTGLQEVSSLIHRYGSGITQGIGTGGRDVKDQVGGLVFLPAMDALIEDEATEVLLLVSKPTGGKVLKGVVDRIRGTSKPIIVAMLGGDRAAIEEAGGVFASNLEEGARLAVEAVVRSGKVNKKLAQLPAMPDFETEAVEAVGKISAGRTDLRALYTGGTLCYEALLMLSDRYPMKTNVPLKPEQKMKDSFSSAGHCAVDLGEDEFTQGRPHPMMEPSLRTERIAQEAKDPKTALILLDFVLGYGSHDDPVGEALHTLGTVMKKGVCVAASVTGTEEDPQDYSAQRKKLKQAGVHVFDSNAEAVMFADKVLAKLLKGDSK